MKQLSCATLNWSSKSRPISQIRLQPDPRRLAGASADSHRIATRQPGKHASRRVARYEEHVTKLDDKDGFIDLFWPGVLLVEQKSAGRSLTGGW